MLPYTAFVFNVTNVITVLLFCLYVVAVSCAASLVADLVAFMVPYLTGNMYAYFHFSYITGSIYVYFHFVVDFFFHLLGYITIFIYSYNNFIFIVSKE